MSRLKKILRSFWGDGLSIDESKVSVLILVFIAAFGVAAYLAIKKDDIPSNCLELLQTLAFVIGGVNGIESIFGKKKGDEAE